ANLPDAALLHVLVLGDPHAPLVELARLRGLDEHAPAAFGGPTVRSDVDDRLELHLVVKAALARKLGADMTQVVEDVGLGEERSTPFDFILGVVGEQISS